jgi:hypothetical protein
MAAEEVEREAIDNEAMISTWYHYGLAGLLFGVGGTILGIWQLADDTGAGVREMATALLVLCPLMTVLALVSLTIAHKMRTEIRTGMRTEIRQHNTDHAPRT